MSDRSDRLAKLINGGEFNEVEDLVTADGATRWLQEYLIDKIADKGLTETGKLVGRGPLDSLVLKLAGVKPEALIQTVEGRNLEARRKTWAPYEDEFGKFDPTWTRGEIDKKIKESGLGHRAQEAQLALIGADNKRLTTQLQNQYAINKDSLKAQVEQAKADNLHRENVRLDELQAAKANTELEREKMIWQNKLEERKWDALQKEKDLARVDTLVSAIPQIAALFL